MHPFENSGKEEYGFWSALVELLKPKRVLEIGTSSGVGTLALARNANAGAEIITVDITDCRSEAVKRNLPGNVRVRFICESSHAALENFLKNHERFDLIVIDGGHLYDTVRRDWYYANRLADIVIFHDAIQFIGVSRVVNEIRHDPNWDVSVLSYPGTTLFDDRTGKPFFSNRRPGMAIATRRTKSFDGFFKSFWEHPSPNSRRALKRRTVSFQHWHSSANRMLDLSFADWEMIFHTLWNFDPDAVIHAGHVGTGATLLFMEFAKARRAGFLGFDPTDGFWHKKKPDLPSELTGVSSATILGKCHIDNVFSFVRNYKRILLWVDEFYDRAFYGRPLRELIRLLPKASLACIRNFSPYDGRPGKVIIGEAECTNTRAHAFCGWLRRQPFTMRLASPEATFADYVNAGHWLMVSRPPVKYPSKQGPFRKRLEGATSRF